MKAHISKNREPPESAVIYPKLHTAEENGMLRINTTWHRK